LSTTDDKKTTDERVENSFRTMNNRTVHHVDTHRDLQVRKALQAIEDRLEREYKFYQVKTSTKDSTQEKVPEMLLREAADETIKKLSKMAPQYSNILFKIRDCYGNCIKTTISDFDSKNKEIKKLKKENNDLKQTVQSLNKDLTLKDKSIVEINKEIVKFKKAKKENDKKFIEMEQYAREVKKNSGKWFGKYDEQKVLKEIQELIKENEDVKCIARELKAEIEYGKQRENKLMYFLFLMQQKNYPVFDIFEEHIKDLPTSRFSTNLDDKFKEIYIEQKKRMKDLGLIGDFDIACTERAVKLKKLDQRTDVSFLTEESYEPILDGPMPKYSKPKVVPSLDFKQMNKNLSSQKRKAKEQIKSPRQKNASSNRSRRANRY
jgi:hypothetical protein